MAERSTLRIEQRFGYGQRWVDFCKMLQGADLKIDDVFTVPDIGDAHDEALAICTLDVEVLVTFARQWSKLSGKREVVFRNIANLIRFE
jgi:hypothetical protein